MEPLLNNNDEAVAGANSRLGAAFEIVLIFLVFFIHGAWPVPEVNEAHYLSKAKHYWNPQWCEQDFFCNAADAHQVFYWTFGWLTLWLPLPAVAWVGRVLTWSLIAWAWRRLSWSLVPVRFASVLSAGLFIVLLHRCHLAGEWVIGGVEAKGFAFALGLLGIDAVVRNRWNRAWLWFGAASAFHVLVGGWMVVAAGFAWILMRCSGTEKPRDGRPWALAAGGLLALPGLIPALMLMRGVSPDVAHEAARIYVVERLPHHMVPQKFPWDFILRFAAMLGVWTVLARNCVHNDRERRLVALVNGGLVIAAVGLALGFAANIWPEHATSLLRYYWFRTSDVIVPLGLALLLTGFMCRQLEKSRLGVLWLTVAIVAVGWHLVGVIRERGPHPVPPADKKIANWRDWKEVCEWASANTATDAVFLTPRMASTFRWYANRAEVVSWKDIPQDAAGIVEWWRRMTNVHHRVQYGPFARWRQSLTLASPAELVRLGNEYHAEYLITEALPPLPFELVSPPNTSYAVYRLPKRWDLPEVAKPQAE